ncbi:MAG: cyclic-phosphate processing receiver domain-containing protein [Candidatus Omnitrophota bacterium]|jgi:hypothetical protein
MSILFLDDCPERTKVFRSAVPSAITVATAVDCINFLSDGENLGWVKWDWVFLDHDLGGKEAANSADPDTGMEVVRWIIEHKPKIDKIIVHTLNKAAGQQMVSKLHDAGYWVLWVPFAWKYTERVMNVT